MYGIYVSHISLLPNFGTPAPTPCLMPIELTQKWIQLGAGHGTPTYPYQVPYLVSCYTVLVEHSPKNLLLRGGCPNAYVLHIV